MKFSEQSGRMMRNGWNDQVTLAYCATVDKQDGGFPL